MDWHDFDHIVPYRKSSRVMRFLYKMIQQIYHQIEKRGRIHIGKKRNLPDQPEE